MKYEYNVEEKHDKHWRGLYNASTYKIAKLLLKGRKDVWPELHHRISRRIIGKWEVIKEVKPNG